MLVLSPKYVSDKYIAFHETMKAFCTFHLHSFAFLKKEKHS